MLLRLGFSDTNTRRGTASLVMFIEKLVYKVYYFKMPFIVACF